jgi:hypothetical protein
MEQTDEWAEARRYMGPHILTKISGINPGERTTQIAQEVNAIEPISA